jgi:hypothetical protein
LSAAEQWFAMTPEQRRELCARIVPTLAKPGDDEDGIDTQPFEDALQDSVTFVSESIGELNCIAAAKAWQDRDAMELLRLFDNAFESYKRHYIGKALGERDPSGALRNLARIYGGDA